MRNPAFRQKVDVVAADIDLIVSQAESSIAHVCRQIGWARSNYYERKSRPPSSRDIDNAKLDVELKAAFVEHRARYGAPRLYHEIAERRGKRVGRHRIARRLRALGLRASLPKRFRRTSQSNPEHKPAENLVQREFTAQAPDTTWSGDITYIWTASGWAYLALLMDLCTRMIVGWAVSSTCDEALAREALENAIARRRPGAGLVIHTDRGATYTAKAYRQRLKDMKFVESMSRKGDCLDNAASESLNGTIKREGLDSGTPRNLEHLRTILFEYIETYYNRKRRHSSIGYISPCTKDFEFRNKCGIK